MIAPALLSPPRLTRRLWLTQQVRTAAVVALVPTAAPVRGLRGRVEGPRATRLAAQAELFPAGTWDAVVHRAVEAAMAAGARYADARLTRTVFHLYQLTDEFLVDSEDLGLGVRVLVDGYWGFAASPYATLDDAGRLAQAAVIQAKEDAKGPARPVELGPLAAVTGHWTTPLRIDPFHISVEEKLDHIRYWLECARANNRQFAADGAGQFLRFRRQERVLATSVGSLVSQTVYETGGNGKIVEGKGGLTEMGKRYQGFFPSMDLFGQAQGADLEHLETVGGGWEVILDAKIPEQIHRGGDHTHPDVSGGRPVSPGRYTLVLDGRTMATLLDQTLGIATQLDRALGYEANASGTSYLDDPLTMVGHFPVAAPPVTITANRSAPAELATVAWDDEGVVPAPFTVVKDGVLVDFQTTREQAAWLAPYYQHHGQPVTSHGCAASKSGLYSPLQMTPNLALAPGAAAVGVDELVKEVPDGILVTNGFVDEIDCQARNGLLRGGFSLIKNGRVIKRLYGGGVVFNSLDLWKHIETLGGPATEAVVGFPVDDWFTGGTTKGEPEQATSHTVRAVAALVPNQSVIKV